MKNYFAFLVQNETMTDPAGAPYIMASWWERIFVLAEKCLERQPDRDRVWGAYLFKGTPAQWDDLRELAARMDADPEVAAQFEALKVPNFEPVLTPET